MAVFRYLFGISGRLDRRGYGLAVLGWLLWLMLAQRFVVGLPDFAASGHLLNLLWDGDSAWGRAVDSAARAANGFEARYVILFALLATAFASFLALTARRLHDMGRPGGYAWIAVLPFLGPQPVFYVLLLLPGDVAANRYGDPGGRPGRSDEDPAITTDPPTGA